jgi:hypothetical protein
MGRRASISVALLAFAAIGALAIIVFNINWRGHYVYCLPDGCLSPTAVGRFALPFAFLFVKHTVVLFGLWFVGVVILQIRKNSRGVGRKHPEALGGDYWISER